MLEDGKEREVITRIGDRRRVEKSAGVGREFRSEGAWEGDFLNASFSRGEKLLKNERVSFRLVQLEILDKGLGNRIYR